MLYETIMWDSENEWIARCRQEGHHVKVIREQDLIVQYFIGSVMATQGIAYHRLDGPAWISLHDERVTFAVHDEIHHDTKLFCARTGMDDKDTFMWLLRFGDKLPTTCEEYYGDGWGSMSLSEF